MMVARSLLGLSLYLSLVSSAGVPVHAQTRTALQLPPLADQGQAQAQARAEAVPPPALTPAPPTPLELELAIQKAADDLLSRAALDDTAEEVNLVIDPLIDGVTGAQSSATHLEERRIIELVKNRYPRFHVVPFSPESILLKQPLVLIGTFTPINNDGDASGPRDAYRICLALADLGKQTIVSKGSARALPEGVDPTPDGFFKESPGYAKDPATEAYVKSCQEKRVGDSFDQAYSEGILAASLVNQGIEAYNAGRYRAALDLYMRAVVMPGGEQLRVFNGIYLASYKLHRTRTAMDAFGRMIDFGLKNSDYLAIKFLFKPGSTQFYNDPNAHAPYNAWIGKIAERTATNQSCLEVIGHTSATGLPALNDRLSVLRADFIKERVEAEESSLQGRLLSSGKGSREMLVGTGRDDPSDALDRRVEFKILRCQA
jgi:outer membrane protein OmpA-like peptidoglycan-associated protein